ncbi:Pre-mRNA processing ribonucleoprotein, binding domain protein [Methanosalsum zhilinae DSM 4017]|uniref:Pre-mRNA processing ribonucleoprotein, binding domain protein n=1 Tax=Methanosalsum zhilinae (strain DSM 4017 / NBRC 107636 / OCM 62 / WeN5) TaxID=679901 RepID=F7XME9_METZD|nr:hypothetical protein [Methanosalsum zhilinae]AEH61802.1 Pre-mRNA processing ribonucleoprotein, binding domain protein [Methanosalsum zhilinae DSM 4017]
MDTMEHPAWFGSLLLDDDSAILRCDVAEKDIQILGRRLMHLPVPSCHDSRPAGRNLVSDAIHCGFINSSSEYYDLLRRVCIRAVKLEISSMESPDIRIVQAINALDDIDETSNALSERLLEWYGAHFPELKLTGDELAKFVAEHGSRTNINTDSVYFEKARTSMGISLTPEDEAIMQDLGQTISDLYRNRRDIEKYIRDSMEKTAPNLTEIAGPLLGARLISIAGGLEKLAKMPSSTIQVLGANRALFKHLRSRAPSPKHGVIFNHPLIKGSPWWQRGRIARAFASTIAMAARKDSYSENLQKDAQLTKRLEAKIEEIKRSSSSPPKSKKPKKKSSGRAGRRK